jgi:hypothetical protein
MSPRNDSILRGTFPPRTTFRRSHQLPFGKRPHTRMKIWTIFFPDMTWYDMRPENKLSRICHWE